LSQRTEFRYAPLYAVLIMLATRFASAQVPTLVVRDAWTRQTPGSDVAAVYLTLHNPTQRPITVVGIESSAASHAMIHETRTEGGISKMRAHEQLVVAPGETLKFEPGGLHVMLHGLSQPLAVGQNVTLIVELADGTRIPTTAIVRPLTAP
jgi:copper(I)-binding protein